MSDRNTIVNSGNASVQENVLQPTVRVMRLYKPGFHFTPTFPQVESGEMVRISKFPLSPFLLLPDSFGDIYTGEKFSAYIAVVNGHQNISFSNLSLSVRLQTSSMVIDLFDSADQPMQKSNSTTNPQLKVMNTNDKLDMIVQHPLDELGAYTLRVSVNYFLSNSSSEPKTLRKLYRFFVLQPLNIESHFLEVNGRFMVQCKVTNITKSPMFIEEMNFVPSVKHSSMVNVVKQVRLQQEQAQKDFLMMVQLQPDESYAFSFVVIVAADDASPTVPTTIGYPEVQWCTSMGEFSTFRGEDTARKISANKDLSTLRVTLRQCPAAAVVGEEFSVTIRISNPTNLVVPLLMNIADVSVNAGLIIVGITSRYIDSIDAGASIELPLSVFAASAGLHSLRGLRLLDASNKKLLFSPETELSKVYVAEDDQIVVEEQPDLDLGHSLHPLPAPAMTEEVSASLVSSYFPTSVSAPVVDAEIAVQDPHAYPDDPPVYSEAQFDSPLFVDTAVGADAEMERITSTAMPEADAEPEAEAEAVLAEVAEMQEVGVERISEEGSHEVTFPGAAPATASSSSSSSPLAARGLSEELSSELLASASSASSLGREDEGPSFSVSVSVSVEDDALEEEDAE